MQKKAGGEKVFKNSVLKKIVIILSAMILVPAVFFTISEISAYNENEQLLNTAYKQQLDIILFSVNQYAWDYLNTWTSKLDMILARRINTLRAKPIMQNDIDELKKFISDNSVFRQFTLYNSSLEKILIVSADNMTDTVITSGQDHYVRQNADLLKKLAKLKKQDYRKIESFELKSDSLSPALIGLVYLTGINNETAYSLLVIQADIFINNAISRRLNELAGANLACAVFDERTRQAITSTQELAYEDALVRNKLWIFPNHSLGIGFNGLTLSDFTSRRLVRSIALIAGVTFVLIIGVWLVYKNTRKEMQLAQMKSDFVSNVSHELRTPLSLIRLYAEALEMDRLPTAEKKMEYYKNISQEAERLTHLINNILNFSRMESGKKQYAFASVDINELVSHVIETYRDSVIEKGYILEQSLADDNLIIEADREAISESLINLIDNAVKYSNDEKYIKISTARTDNHALICVEDHGTGIAPENQQKVFEKFYRESNALIHNTKGSGLGLTLVQHNMQAHHGDVTLKSAPGKGSRFCLHFPLNRSNYV
ncbi:MAG: GHKL domain-containing protein [Calditrichaceae bacterium]|nr:GHKL domain-containing protein [Calditrichaceae bacterium]MBN2709278.1 GHKL domain-containing protein [Calditrichaceae bacterium]